MPVTFREGSRKSEKVSEERGLDCGIKKESMQILREKSKAKSQVTFDEDFNVPDVKPDIGR